MKTITINSPELLYIQGDYSYKQGIRGGKNFEHIDRNKHYNGSGGEQIYTASKLNLYGITGEKQEIRISVKDEILKTFDRSKLNETFVDKLQEKMPDAIQLEIDDDGTAHISQQSCIDIYRTIHPRKKLNNI